MLENVPDEFLVAAPKVPPAPPATPPAATTPPASPAPTAPPAGTPPATPPVTPPAEGEPPVELTITPPTPAAPTPPPDQVVVYEPTGDSGLDVALQYVGERGFGPDHPAMKAAMTGDFVPLEAELAKLGDKAPGHKAFVTLAKDSYARRQDAAKAAKAATAKVVYDAVGGPEKWAEIQAWAQTNADDAEKASLNASFRAGGVAAAAAAQYLAGLYAKHGKTTPKPVVTPNAGAAPAASGTPLSPREFARAVFKLSGELGAKMQDSPEYRALVARRQAFRG